MFKKTDDFKKSTKEKLSQQKPSLNKHIFLNCFKDFKSK